MEVKLNDTVTLDGTDYLCLAKDNEPKIQRCWFCSFNFKTELCAKQECSELHRQDKTNVIFIQVKK